MRCGRAAQQSTGDWLLFTDADIHFRNDVLRRAANYAEKNSVDHLVMFPTHTDWSFSKKVMLAGFNILFMFGHRPWKTADPNSRDHIGVGAFNMIRREVYEKVGTFQTLRMEIIEDMRLGKLVKDAGYKQHNVLGPDLLLLDWGDHALDIVHNLTKNSFSLMHFSVPRTVGAFFLLLGLNLLPFIGTFMGARFGEAAVCSGALQRLLHVRGNVVVFADLATICAVASCGNATPWLHDDALDVSRAPERRNYLAGNSVSARAVEERTGKGLKFSPALQVRSRRQSYSASSIWCPCSVSESWSHKTIPRCNFHGGSRRMPSEVLVFERIRLAIDAHPSR